jgi:hypothetical protein
MSPTGEYIDQTFCSFNMHVAEWRTNNLEFSLSQPLQVSYYVRVKLYNYSNYKSLLLIRYSQHVFLQRKLRIFNENCCLNLCCSFPIYLCRLKPRHFRLCWHSIGQYSLIKEGNFMWTLHRMALYYPLHENVWTSPLRGELYCPINPISIFTIIS